MNEDEIGSLNRTHGGDENEYEKLYVQRWLTLGGDVLGCCTV
jgi:hypothetical protein